MKHNFVPSDILMDGRWVSISRKLIFFSLISVSYNNGIS